MTGKWRLGLHGLALGVTAVAAYWAYSGDSAKSQPGWTILDVAPNQVVRLEYATKGKHMLAEALKDGAGFMLTVREDLAQPRPEKTKADDQKAKDQKAKDQKAQDQETKGQEAKDHKAQEPKPEEPSQPGADAAGQAGKPAGEPKPEEKVTRYRAGDEFNKAVERLLPLRALRELGRFDSNEKMAQFGLSGEPRGTLTVAFRDKHETFLVGDATYGGGSYYVRHAPDGPVYLISASILRALDFRPPRYMERRLVDLDQQKVDRLVVDCGPRGTRELVRREERAKVEESHWAPVDQPDSSDELYRNWVSSLLRLNVEAYGQQEPPLTTGHSTCQFRFFEGQTRLDTVVLNWTGAEPDKREVLAKSDFSAEWVKLHAHHANSVISDLDGVLGSTSR